MSVAEIKRIAELKLEMFKIKSGKNTDGVQDCIDQVLIFEAGAKEKTLTSEELTFLDSVWAFLYSSKMSNEDHNKLERSITKIKELNKVLEGEGGEKEKG